MAPFFDISIDPARKLMTIVVAGFFDTADVERLAAARAAAMRRLNSAAHDHVTLVDVSDARIQAQEVVRAFVQLIGNPAFVSRRIAFVCQGSLARMQVRRMLADADHAQMFDDRASAEAWLFDEARAAA